MSSITYSERIKIETFCELELSNIEVYNLLNRSPATISYELSRFHPYQAELAQADTERKRAQFSRKTKLIATLLEINQRPLKILNWQTPYQVMLTNLSKIRIKFAIYIIIIFFLSLI